MTIDQEAQFREREFRMAMAELRRPESYGAIPGAEPVRGPLLSFCCNAPPLDSIYRDRGIRTGQCGKCFNASTFREIIQL